MRGTCRKNGSQRDGRTATRDRMRQAASVVQRVKDARLRIQKRAVRPGIIVRRCTHHHCIDNPHPPGTCGVRAAKRLVRPATVAA